VTAASQTLTVQDVSYERLAGSIDHSLLRPELTLDEVRAGCAASRRSRSGLLWASRTAPRPRQSRWPSPSKRWTRARSNSTC
jgi:hypothetical protein